MNKIKGPILIKGGTNELMDLVIDNVGKPKLSFTATGMTVTKNAHILPKEFMAKGNPQEIAEDTIVSTVAKSKAKPKTKAIAKTKKDKSLLKEIINSIEEIADIDIDNDGRIGNQNGDNK